ncbi:hypothetical protein V494_07746 [Pseudogymnoascus sp. VKM F-4513 (FW-928)]|nr:hypothetical protein V494_07746 [Pseudogymnoascus sp. VKM F-4513 (FW-928)]
MSGDNWRTDPSRKETISRYVKGMTSTNWRQPRPEGMTQNPSTPKESIIYGCINRMVAKNSYEFTPGKIACVWTFTEDRNNRKQSEVDRTKEDLLTPNIPGANINVFVKSRKYIVIGRFTDHYLALPIFTHKGHGLASKPELKGEFVSIRNMLDSDSCSKTDTNHGCIYTTTTRTTAGWKAIGARANVCFTSPLAIPYRNMANFLGELAPESLSYLCELYMMATKNYLSATLDGLNPSLWSVTPNSLGSEKRKRQADAAESEKQNSPANSTQPVKQTYSGAAQTQTYAGSVTGQTISGAATEETAAPGQASSNTTGFQPLKRPREPEPLDENSANPAKKGKN